MRNHKQRESRGRRKRTRFGTNYRRKHRKCNCGKGPAKAHRERQLERAAAKNNETQSNI